jgi:hypothetical protein
MFFRFLVFALCVWWVCGYFYRLGRKSALNSKEKKSRVKRPGSKIVESSVVEKPADDAQTKE